MKEKLLEIKKGMKKRLPKFSAQDAHKKKKLTIGKWRKPRGLDSKMRHQLKGYRRIVKRGYMSPSEVKDVSLRFGLIAKVVKNVTDLEGIDIKEYGILVGSTVGKKKKVEILKAAVEKKITVMNVKDVDAYLNEHDSEMKKKKEAKESLAKKKQEKEKALKKKSDEKSKKDKSEEDTLASNVEKSEEEKLQEKKEKDKILISTE